MQERMNRLFGDILGRGPLSLMEEEPLATVGFAPPVDIYEDEKHLTLKVEVPGMEEKDLKVQIENGVLGVSGEHKVEKEIKEENFRRRERHYGAFTRSFTLPPSVDPEKIDASYVNGVLTITLAKRAEAQPKQIKVNIGKTLPKAA